MEPWRARTSPLRCTRSIFAFCRAKWPGSCPWSMFPKNWLRMVGFVPLVASPRRSLRFGHWESASITKGAASAIPAVRCAPVDDRALGDDARRVDVGLGHVVVALDVVEVRGLA